VYQERGRVDKQRYQSELALYKEKQKAEPSHVISDAVPINQRPASESDFTVEGVDIKVEEGDLVLASKYDHNSDLDDTDESEDGDKNQDLDLDTGSGSESDTSVDAAALGRVECQSSGDVDPSQQTGPSGFELRKRKIMVPSVEVEKKVEVSSSSMEGGAKTTEGPTTLVDDDVKVNAGGSNNQVGGDLETGKGSDDPVEGDVKMGELSNYSAESDLKGSDDPVGGDLKMGEPSNDPVEGDSKGSDDPVEGDVKMGEPINDPVEGDLKGSDDPVEGDVKMCELYDDPVEGDLKTGEAYNSPVKGNDKMVRGSAVEDRVKSQEDADILEEGNVKISAEDIYDIKTSEDFNSSAVNDDPMGKEMTNQVMDVRVSSEDRMVDAG
jgi:hypothetical protein